MNNELTPALPTPIPAAGNQPVTPVPAYWNYKALLPALGITWFLQMLFLPCMCSEGEMKMSFAMLFDLFVVVRILIAFLRKERGRTWLFYAVILYTSPIWISVLVMCLYLVW